MILVGSEGGTSGRAMVFCLGMPDLNPGTDLCFFSSELMSFVSLGVGLFLLT